MATILEYKCPCCGGATAYDTKSGKMKCPYCDTEFDIDTLRSYDEDLKKEGEDSMVWETPSATEWSAGMRVYSCTSCGGEIIGDDTTAATSCPFCGNPVIMMGQFSGELRPDYVIPFKLDKNAAKEGLKRHLKGKPLLPKVFSDENHIDEIRGIYVPFWLYSSDADGDVRYAATKVRHWSDSDYDYTETSHYSVTRAGELSFENVPADGSSKITDTLMESIEPYDFSDAVDFATAYLAGYFADKYDVGSDECAERANERIKNSTLGELGSTVSGYTTLVMQSGSVRLHGAKVKYALYPVWILNTSWKGKKYTFAMNGQTGKFVGDLPVSAGAFNKWLWGLTAALSAVIFGILMLIANM